MWVLHHGLVLEFGTGGYQAVDWGQSRWRSFMNALYFVDFDQVQRIGNHPAVVQSLRKN